MTPAQIAAMAEALNRARSHIEALDDVAALFAELCDEADTEYGRMFRDQCIMGE